MTQPTAHKGERARMAGAVADLPWDKIDLSVPAGDQIYHTVRAAILDMQLPPGCPVSEAEIGTKLGASRTPVREALLRLREEGLVHTLPSRGSFVSRLSRDRIRESQFLREALELASVHKVAEMGLSPEGRLALENNLSEQVRAAKDEDYPHFHELDDAFHALIAEATGFTRTAKVLAREKVQLDRLRHLSLTREGHLAALLAEHQSIYASLSDNQVEAAVSRMRAHCRTVLGVLEDLSRQHREYFD